MVVLKFSLISFQCRKMSYHSCNRLLAAFDITISCFSLIIWIIYFIQSEDLIKLQFETHEKNESLVQLIDKHRPSIRSVGNLGSNDTSAEILQNVYEIVHANCMNQSYNSSNLSEAQDHLQKVLIICVSLIMISISMFFLSSLILSYLTRRGMAGHKVLLLTYLVVQLLFTMEYGGAATVLLFNHSLCALKNEVDSIRLMVALIIVVYKPLQMYVSFRYYREVARCVYVEELESSSEGSIRSGSSSNEDYISDSKARLSNAVDESRAQIDKAEDLKNQNRTGPIYRQFNATDILKSHDLQMQKMERAKKFEGKLLVRGKGPVPLAKVGPEDKKLELQLT